MYGYGMPRSVCLTHSTTRGNMRSIGYLSLLSSARTSQATHCVLHRNTVKAYHLSSSQSRFSIIPHLSNVTSTQPCRPINSNLFLSHTEAVNVSFLTDGCVMSKFVMRGRQPEASAARHDVGGIRGHLKHVVSQFIADPSSREMLMNAIEYALDDVGREQAILSKVFGRETLQKVVDSGARGNYDVIRDILFPDGRSASSQVVAMRMKVNELRTRMRNMKRGFIEDIGIARVSVQALVRSAVANVHESQVNRGGYLERISDAHRRFREIDIPKMRNRYEAEIAEHVENEERLEKELRLAKRKISRFSRQSQKTDDTIRALRNRLVELEGDNDDLNDNRLRAKAFEGKSSVLQRELKEKRGQIDDYLTELQGSAYTESAIQAALASARAQLREKDDEIKRLKRTVNDLEEKAVELEGAWGLNEAGASILEAKVGRFEAVKRERDEAIKAMYSLNTSIEDAETKNRCLVAENEAIRLELTGAKRDLNSVVSTNAAASQLSAELSRLKEEHTVSVRECRAKDQHIFNLTTDLQNEKRRLHNEAQAFRDEQAAKSEITLELNDVIKANKDFEAQNRKLKQALRAATDKGAELQNMIQRKDREITSLCESTGTMKGQNDELAVSLGMAQEQITRLGEEISECNESIRFHFAQKREDGAKIEDLTTQLTLLEQESGTLRSRADALDNEKVALSGTVRELQNRTGFLTRRIDEQTGAIDRLTADDNEMREANRQLMATKVKLTESTKKQKAEIGILRSQVNDVTSRLAEAEGGLKISKEQVTTLERNLQKLTAKSNRTEQALNKTQERAARDTTEARQVQTELKSKNIALRGRLEQAVAERDEIQRSLNECRRDIATTQSALANEHTRADDLVTAIHTVCDGCGTDKLNKLPGLVSSMRDANNDLDAKVRRIRNALRVTGDCDMDEFCQQLTRKADEMAARENEIVHLLGRSSESGIVSAVAEMKTKLVEESERRRKLETVVPELDVSTLQGLVRQNRELQAKEEAAAVLLRDETVASIRKTLDDITKVLPAETSRDGIASSVAKFANASRVLTECEDMIRSQFRSTGTMQENVSRLIARHSKLAESEALIPRDVDGRTFTDRLARLVSRHQELTDIDAGIPNEVKGQTIGSKVAKLIKRHNILADLEGVTPSSLGSDFISRFNNLIRRHERFAEVERAVPTTLGSDTLARVNNLTKRHERLAEIESVIPSASAHEVSALREIATEATKMFNEVYSIIIGSSMAVKFPLGSDLREKAFATVKRFKSQSLNHAAFVERILRQAKSLGFVGTDVDEAVVFVISNTVADEKQKALEQMHKEMSDMRALNERERTVFERGRDRLKKKLTETREQVVGAQTRLAQREEEVIQEIDQEQQSARRSVADLVRERGITEELMRVITGQPVDIDILRARLSAADLTAILHHQRVI